MYRVELKASQYAQASTVKRRFLMYRVELKVFLRGLNFTTTKGS